MTLFCNENIILSKLNVSNLKYFVLLKILYDPEIQENIRRSFIRNSFKKKKSDHTDYIFQDQKGQIVEETSKWHPTLIKFAKKIPDPMEEVVLAPLDSRVWAVGKIPNETGNKKKVKYLYTEKHKQSQNYKKHCALLSFAKEYKTIQKQCSKLLIQASNANNINRDHVTALVVTLLFTCAFRIGSQKPKDESCNRGILYIMKKHIQIEDDKKISIRFIGKCGKNNKCAFKHSLIAKLLKRITENLDDNEFVFRKHVNFWYVLSFLKKFSPDTNSSIFSPKSFRNVKTHELLIKSIRSWVLDTNLSERERRKKLNDAIEKNATFLFHSANIQKKYYLSPHILNLIEKSDPIILKPFENRQLSPINIYIQMLDHVCNHLEQKDQFSSSSSNN